METVLYLILLHATALLPSQASPVLPIQGINATDGYPADERMNFNVSSVPVAGVNGTNSSSAGGVHLAPITKNRAEEYKNLPTAADSRNARNDSGRSHVIVHNPAEGNNRYSGTKRTHAKSLDACHSLALRKCGAVVIDEFSAANHRLPLQRKCRVRENFLHCMLDTQRNTCQVDDEGEQLFSEDSLDDLRQQLIQLLWSARGCVIGLVEGDAPSLK